MRPFQCSLASKATRFVHSRGIIHVLLIAMAAALCICAPSAATATPITYHLVGVTAYSSKFSGSGTNTLTGTFTFDTSGPTLDAVNIIVCCVTFGATYSVTTSEDLTSSSFEAEAPAPFTFLSMDFEYPLDVSIDPISSITFYIYTGLAYPTTPAGTAQTSATPLPAALPLFATGLGGLGLFGWRRKRKAQAVA